MKYWYFFFSSFSFKFLFFIFYFSFSFLVCQVYKGRVFLSFFFYIRVYQNDFPFWQNFILRFVLCKNLRTINDFIVLLITCKVIVFHCNLTSSTCLLSVWCHTNNLGVWPNGTIQQALDHSSSKNTRLPSIFLLD